MAVPGSPTTRERSKAMSAPAPERSRRHVMFAASLAMAMASALFSPLSTQPALAQDEAPPSTWSPAGDTTVPPTTVPPTTQAPTTEAPTTEAPTTEVPTTEAPTTTAGSSDTTASSEPTTAPTTEAGADTTQAGAEGSDTTATDDSTTSTLDESTTSLPDGCAPADAAGGDGSTTGGADGSTPAPTPTDPTTTSSEGDGEITFTTNENGETIIIDGCTVTTIDPDDPGAFEEQAEDVPDVDLTVPPRRGAYANQPDFVPNQVVFSNVQSAQAKLEGVRAEYVESVATVKTLRLRLKELRQRQDELDEDTRELLLRLEAAQVRMETRALQAFVRGDSFSLNSGLDQEALLEAQVQQTMMQAVLDQDQAAIEEFANIRAQLSTDDLLLYDRIKIVERSIIAATDRAENRAGAIEQAEVELEAFEAGSDVFIQDLHYPIQWPYDVPLIDSYGYPRATGTADEHWHEGIDLFAPYGTPLLAVERGVISRIGNGRLGGLTFWLRGESGTDWYYAHLSSFAPGLAVGQVVEAGDVVGAVGTSGNARGTPPHLHMQMHPDGGRPLNPYPILYVRVQKDAELREQAAQLEAAGIDVAESNDDRAASGYSPPTTTRAE